MKQGIFIVGLFIYLCLLILALLFFEERTVFVDIAYHLFCIIKDGTFAIQNKRFGAFITQIFPLVSSQLSLPLSIVMKVYSAGFIIYYFLVFIVCLKYFNNLSLALVVLFLNTLFVTDTFYWMQSELPQGLAMLVLLFAIIKHLSTLNNNRQVWFVILFVITVMVAFFHPLIIFPFTFFCLFFILNKQFEFSSKWIIITVLIYLSSVVLKSTVLKSPYDSSAFGALKNFILLFPDYFTIPANKVFLNKMLTNYYFIPLLSLCLFIYFLIKKEFLNLALFFMFALGYVLLINVSYYKGDSAIFYMENLYLPLSLIIALPFSYFILNNIKPKYTCVIIAIIGVVALFRIFNSHQLYTERLSYLSEILTKYKNEKVIIDDEKFDNQKLLMSWGTPYEMWLLSTVKNKQTASIVLHYNPDELVWATNNSKAFLTSWGLFDYNNMPKEYFIFKDTVSVYKIIYEK